MKVKVLNTGASAARDSKLDVAKVRKNADPLLHPFERAREYSRALVAVKLDRVFAKPFIGALTGHSDGVYCSSTSPRSLVSFVSGAADGEVVVWDLAARAKLWSVYGHAAFVRGVAVAADGEHFFSCGDDKTIKQWRMSASVGDAAAVDTTEAGADGGGRAAGKRARGSDDNGVRPVTVWRGKHAFTYLDHAWSEARFATASSVVDIWDYARSEPVQSFSWGADTINAVRFNPAEPHVLGSTGNDRGVCLYDIRADAPIRKVVLSMVSNALAWNPREPFNFSVANEDSNCYSFDMRKLDRALMVHKDHAAAVMDIHYSPTGKEFVSASYDRTVRIWRADAGKSREVYHTKRMQRVFTARFTGDAKYVLSGSDDMNVRIWKADASAPLGRQLPRERARADYLGTLKKRFAHLPEIRRIATQRYVPKGITKAAGARHADEQRSRRRLANVRAHTAEGAEEAVAPPERKKAVVMELK